MTSPLPFQALIPPLSHTRILRVMIVPSTPAMMLMLLMFLKVKSQIHKYTENQTYIYIYTVYLMMIPCSALHNHHVLSRAIVRYRPDSQTKTWLNDLVEQVFVNSGVAEVNIYGPTADRQSGRALSHGEMRSTIHSVA